jgi:hypothetical protein
MRKVMRGVEKVSLVKTERNTTGSERASIIQTTKYVCMYVVSKVGWLSSGHAVMMGWLVRRRKKDSERIIMNGGKYRIRYLAQKGYTQGWVSKGKKC